MDDMHFWILIGSVMVPMILLASWIDYRQHRVPNWLNAALMASGMVVQTTLFGWTGLQAAFLGLLVGLGLLILPWLMNLMGAGDVKMLAGIGAWLGPKLVFWSFVYGAVIGGVIGLVMILVARRARPALVNLANLVAKCSSRQAAFSEMGSVRQMGEQAHLLPYGVPLMLGTLVVLILNYGGWLS